MPEGRNLPERLPRTMAGGRTFGAKYVDRWPAILLALRGVVAPSGAAEPTGPVVVPPVPAAAGEG